MRGPATELIHAGEADRGVAVPLTTPIYETTTFVFDTREEVARLQRRAIVEAISTRATRTRPSSAVEQKLAALDRAEAALTFSSRAGRDDDDPDGASEGGRRGGLQRGNLRRHAASAAGRPRAVRHHAAIRLARGSSRDPIACSPTGRALVWFESPINPTLRCVDIKRDRRRVPSARRAVDHRQHLRQPDQSAAAARSASISRCRARRST